MKALFAILICLCAAGAAPAIVHEVPGDYATIQEGILAAGPGDTVRVADGTYAGPGNRDLDFLGKPILVTSASGDPDSCTIDCGGSWLEPHRGFWFHSGEDTLSVLRGFRIVNGYTAGYGGAILCGQEGTSTPASPRIAFCALDSNESVLGAALDLWGNQCRPQLDSLLVEKNTGNGLGFYEGAAPTLIHACRVIGNTGYGIYVIAGIEEDHPILVRCELSGNQKSGIRYFSMFGRLRLEDCIVANNQEWGIYANAAEAGQCVVEGGEVFLNKSGGINVGGTVDGHCTNVYIHDNGGPGFQAGFYAYYHSLSDCEIANNNGDGVLFKMGNKQSSRITPSRGGIIRNCTIHDNAGMGIDFDIGFPDSYSIADCVISRNGSHGIGLSIRQDHEGHLDVNNNTVVFNGGDGIRHTTSLSWPLPCTLANNLVAFNDGQGLVLNFTDFLDLVANDSYGNTLGDWPDLAGDYLGRDGNFSGNPLFVDADADDLTLAENSPCLPGNHPDGYDALIGAEEQGGGPIDYAPDSVALAPSGRVHMRPGDVLELGVALFDAAGDTVPDQGVPPALSAESGLGVLSAPVLQGPSDWTWRAAYTAGSASGVDLLRVVDPECATRTTDSLFVDITETAILTSVTDIAGDQGGQVRVRWERDLHDVLGDPLPITQYVVWRRVDDDAFMTDRSAAAAPDLDAIAAAHGAGGAPPLWSDAQGALWEPVGPVVPAMLWDLYASVVPTLRDSVAGDPALFVFQVSAHTPQPQTFFVSAPDSGCSVDNIAPQAPTGLHRAGSTVLTWDASPDADFRYFTVYGSELAGLDGSATLIGHATGTSLDIGPQPHAYLLLTATDAHGNEGAEAVLDALTAAADAPETGLRLHPNLPNPFNPCTTIRYSVPTDGRVTLRVFDVRGGLVRVLVDAEQPRGDHRSTWDGRDAAGRAVASGGYFARLEAGGRTRTVRMLLVR